MPNRIRNYEIELVKFANNIVGKEYEWGSTDCGSIVLSGLEIILNDFSRLSKLPRWFSMQEALHQYKHVDINNILENTGAFGVDRSFIGAGDVAVSPNKVDGGIPSLSLVLPLRKILVSTPETGVMISHFNELDENTRFWRYE